MLTKIVALICILPMTQAQVSKAYVQLGGHPKHAHAFARIVQLESRGNPSARNPRSTAYGMGQLLKSTRKRYGGSSSCVYEQLDAMKRYIEDRYTTPSRALRFHRRRGYY